MKTLWHWSPDPVADVLHALRLEDSFYSRSDLGAPWGIEIPSRNCTGFHFVAQGSTWILCEDRHFQLEAGDMVFFVHGQKHSIASAPDVPLAPVESLHREMVGSRSCRLKHGGDGERALVLCGGMRFEPEDHPLLNLLPHILLLRGKEADNGAWLQLSIETMRKEASSSRVGSESFLTRLAELLLIESIRRWMESNSDLRQGWLAALMDPQIGRVLALMHRESDRQWTIETLSSEAAMSKSVFCERFREAVGVPPLQYLTRLQMQLAMRWIRTQRMPLYEVAERLGYGSEAAFSRAFKRHMGIPPGAMKYESAARNISSAAT